MIKFPSFIISTFLQFWKMFTFDSDEALSNEHLCQVSDRLDISFWFYCQICKFMYLWWQTSNFLNFGHYPTRWFMFAFVFCWQYKHKFQSIIEGPVKSLLNLLLVIFSFRPRVLVFSYYNRSKRLLFLLWDE